MRFQITSIAALAAFASALPTLKVRQSGPVLASTTYDAISISGGQAGNAEAEALAVFSALDVNNPGNIDPADIDFLGQVNDVANQAEVGAFNPAIEAATGAEADALSAGKIKNKVLKLMATKIELEAKQAQGEDVADKLAEETTKLNNNIATDTKNAGNPSTALPFDANITGGGATAAGAGAAAGGNNQAAAGGNNNQAAAGGNNQNTGGNNNNANQDDAAADDSAANDNADDNADDDNNQNAAEGNNNNANQDDAANDNADDDNAQDDAAEDDNQNNNNAGNNNAGNNNAGNNAGGDNGAVGNFLFGGNQA